MAGNNIHHIKNSQDFAKKVCQTTTRGEHGILHDFTCIPTEEIEI